MTRSILTLDAASAFVALTPERFLELVDEGFYPPPIDRDPKRPEWHRTELLAVMEAREHRRLEKMIAAGLVAETEPAPKCRRLESGPVPSAKAAGALCLALAGRGTKAYRRGIRDYRVFMPAGRRPDVLARDVAVLCPQTPFVLIEAEPTEPEFLA